MSSKQKDMEQEKKLIERYSPARKTPNEKFLAIVMDLFKKSKTPSIAFDTILLDILQAIQSFATFNELTIGLRDSDGLYRFKAMIGFRPEALQARKEISYTVHDMKDYFTYKPVIICRFTNFHVVERKPFKPGMEEMYNRPDMLEDIRRNPDDMIEGDYVEVIITGKDRDILGWFELSGTSDGKLPSRETLIQLEFFSQCIVPILIENMKK